MIFFFEIIIIIIIIISGNVISGKKGILNPTDERALNPTDLCMKLWIELQASEGFIGVSV